jgi:ribosomal-protein-alanine N-acetyltransferase
MQPADIPQVLVIDHVSYAMTWPPRAYDHELKQNDLAHYFVLRLASSRSGDQAGGAQAPIVGVGGFWLLAGEAHITTIAIHPDRRRLGLGEWMLVRLLEEGLSLKANVATLEVRPSNGRARALYRKYDFREVGRRLGYYSDNGEDALILTSPPLLLPIYQVLIHQRKAALVQKLAQINVDKMDQIN